MSGRRKVYAALITLLAAVALGVSAYLTWVSWQAGTVAGCTTESLLDCDDVLTSKWSKWMGLPVSLFGLVTYLFVLGVTWPAAARPQGYAMTALFAVAMLAAGSAAWFVGLQAIHIQKFCLYCLTVHTCGAGVGILSLLMLLDRSGANDYDQMRSLLGVEADQDFDMPEPAGMISGAGLLTAIAFSAVGLSALMGGQLLTDAPESMPMEEVVFEPSVAETPNVPVVENDADSTEVDLKEEMPADLAVESNPDEELLAADTESDPDNESSLFEEPDFGQSDTIESIFGSSTIPENATNSSEVVFQALPEGVDVSSMPMLGSPDASHVLLEMIDYTCKHCRHLHPHIHAAVERYGDQIAVVVYHVPLSKKCNQFVARDFPGKKYACDYAQLAIGVWKLDPKKFPEFHTWLMESEKPPSISKARRRARKLVGDEILLDAEVKFEASKRLANQTTSFQRLKSGLPVLLLQNGALRGVPEQSEKLFEYLEAKLGVEPR